jgi:hypothetical protein
MVGFSVTDLGWVKGATMNFSQGRPRLINNSVKSIQDKNSAVMHIFD